MIKHPPHPTSLRLSGAERDTLDDLCRLTGRGRSQILAQALRRGIDVILWEAAVETFGPGIMVGEDPEALPPAMEGLS